MNILSINCGSSTLKFQLIGMEQEATPNSFGSSLARGIVDGIGTGGRIDFSTANGRAVKEAAPMGDHREATYRVFGWLDSVGILKRYDLDAVGHRVVHGGESYVEPTRIDDEVLESLEAVSGLAPLHNGPSLGAIRAARDILGPTIPMVAVFDTAFHSTLPECAYRYAIPQDLADRHRIRRYGFHGLAHRFMAERYAAITSTPIEETKLITLQLGNGCSATAIEGGRSLDTSMGLTPLEGLMMGTRCGDADPSLVGFLARLEGVEIEEVEGWLNKLSGLLGVSGHSRDMRQLLEREREGDGRAALAIEMFCRRARKYVGAYLALLGGADAVVFGGGIGENAPSIRERICNGMAWCGLVVDRDRNADVVGSEARISADDAKVRVYVIPVKEAVLIARDTVLCIRSPGRERRSRS